MKYVIKNCPACVISPSVCSEWHIKHGGEAKDCSDINDCVMKQIVELCKKIIFLNGGTKSKDRVKELGEVFTNSREVNAMLDLLPNITIDMTFLEPTCGNGNFVIEIMKRKFDLCKKKSDFIKALESVFAIDIMADNIQECKERVKKLYLSYGQKENIDFILDTQIFHGNSLAIMRLIERCQDG